MDDESLLYFPGVFLTGKVVLELDDDTPILGNMFEFMVCSLSTPRCVRFIFSHNRRRCGSSGRWWRNRHIGQGELHRLSNATFG